jgi:signal transduction histidine kinase
MISRFRNLSLRVRLALLAVSAILALSVALFVAWRLARATETFALRQADSSVNGAVRELAHEVATHPDGYRTIDDALPGAAEPAGPADERNPERTRPERPIPKHVETLFSYYSDPYARLTAITLHRFANVEGGFYRPADNSIVGYAFADDASVTAGNRIPAPLVAVIRSLATQAVASGGPVTRTIQNGSERTIITIYPIGAEPVRREPAEPGGKPTAVRGATATGITAAFAIEHLNHISGVSDWPNITALVLLGISIFLVSGIALLTVRDLSSGVKQIDLGLAGLTTDLEREVPPPPTAELGHIAAGINELAANLRSSIARRAKLEEELRRSERLSALGRVVAGVAHEVRNPLAAIKLKVQLAQRSGYAADKMDATFSVVTAEIDRLDALVRRLLELGNPHSATFGVVDLDRLVRDRMAFFRDLAQHSGVDISVDDTKRELPVNGDPDRLGQVVDNLVQNAIEAMPNGGKVKVKCLTLKRADGAVLARITVADTGPGIPDEAREHVFEPFHTGREGGTGLGLAIARSIVEEHGGRLRFEPRDGGASSVIELLLATESQLPDRDTLDEGLGLG